MAFVVLYAGATAQNTPLASTKSESDASTVTDSSAKHSRVEQRVPRATSPPQANDSTKQSTPTSPPSHFYFAHTSLDSPQSISFGGTSFMSPTVQPIVYPLFPLTISHLLTSPEVQAQLQSSASLLFNSPPVPQQSAGSRVTLPLSGLTAPSTVAGNGPSPDSKARTDSPNLSYPNLVSIFNDSLHGHVTSPLFSPSLQAASVADLLSQNSPCTPSPSPPLRPKEFPVRVIRFHILLLCAEISMLGFCFLYSNIRHGTFYYPASVHCMSFEELIEVSFRIVLFYGSIRNVFRTLHRRIMFTQNSLDLVNTIIR